MVDQRKGYGMSSVLVTYLMIYRWLTKGRDTECLKFWFSISTNNFLQKKEKHVLCDAGEFCCC